MEADSVATRHLVSDLPPDGTGHRRETYGSFEGDMKQNMSDEEKGGGGRIPEILRPSTPNMWDAMKLLVRRICWVTVGLPFIITVGGACSYFMGALSTVNLYRFVFPLDALNNHWLVIGVVMFSTVVATIGCVLWMGLMACVWAYPLPSMRMLYTIFIFIGLMGAGQFGMFAAQQYALGDAETGRVYKDINPDENVHKLKDPAGLVFTDGVRPYPEMGASSWIPAMNYATEVCVAPLLKNKKSTKACYWAVSFGEEPTRGCRLPDMCPEGLCQGTTAESNQYKYYVNDAIRRSVTYTEQFKPCDKYISIILRDKIDLPKFRREAYSVANMWLMGGFIAALIMGVCLSLVCRRLVWTAE